jgi:hypothetical protein
MNRNSFLGNKDVIDFLNWLTEGGAFETGERRISPKVPDTSGAADDPCHSGGLSQLCVDLAIPASPKVLSMKNPRRLARYRS